MRRRNVSEISRNACSRHVALAGVLFVLWGEFCFAQDEAPPQADPQPVAPIGQFLSIQGTVDDVVYGRVSRTALALQTRAQQEKRRGILVLEVGPGSSPFHQIHGLAKFLTTEIPSLTTVAWVPQSVTGNHVILALACQEIVMDPQASLGDISLGAPLDQDEQSIVINLVNRRHNRKLSEALVLGMMDRQKEVLWVQLELGTKPNTSRETRIVSRAGYDDLARSGAQILDVKTVKEAGTPGVFTGDRARGYNILVMHTAQARDEVGSLYRLPREAMREDYTAGEAPRAMLIRIDDMIEPILEHFVLRQIDRAVAGGVNLIIFEIESPGGYLTSSFSLANAIADLHEKKVRTVAYIPKQALSGAAIISLGCDEIYLTNHGLIGDAGAIAETGEGQQFEHVPQKMLSPMRDMLKALAERKSRPPALAMAMANKDLQVFEVAHRDSGQISFMTEDEIHLADGVWIKGRQVPESGGDRFLTLDGARAHAVHLAETPVKDFPELKTRLGIPNDVEVTVSARTWVDTLIFVLNTGWATGLLFLLGIMCIYFELHFPTGFFGILACVCFGVFFWSRFLGGTAGWLEVILFLLGIGCLAVELFIVPGFGVFGVSGALLCVFSLILASQTFVIPASTEELRTLARSLGTISGAVVGTVMLAALVSRYLPSIPLFNEMILTPPGGMTAFGEPRLDPQLTGAALTNPVLERDRSLVGKQGTSTTVLRPAGKARIGDELVDVISEGPFISAGRSIEVIEVTGNRVVVRELS